MAKKGRKKQVMVRSSKAKNGERNYSCLNYSKCLTEAAINNTTFNCSGCEKEIKQSFNELLKHESRSEDWEIAVKNKKQQTKN